MTAPEPAGDFPDDAILGAARTAAARRFDPQNGGSLGAPKFPSSFPIRLLLRIARRARDPEAQRMATLTLEHMRSGGIYDQIGGGFHRYATDARWLVPHFEKMLYDNAQLAVAYLEATEATGDARFALTARETLDYVLRDMQAPDGTFYSATDADSPIAGGRREEGAYFTWTPNELRVALGDADAEPAQAWFGVTEHGQVDGRSVLSATNAPAELARQLGLTTDTLEQRLTTIRARLLQERSQRAPPSRDEKVLVSWNGLTISALAHAAIVLGDARYAEAAVRAAGAMRAAARDGRELAHALVAGEAQGKGFADDYALLSAALLDVFELTSDPSWLTFAISLMDGLERGFADSEHGGYYLTSAEQETLLLRDKQNDDGPVPSASSVAAMTWLRLLALTDDPRYRERAEMTLRSASRSLAARPLALADMLLALDWATDAVKQIVIVVPEGRGAMTASARPLLDVLARRLTPNAVLIVASPDELNGELGKHLTWAQAKPLRSGSPTAYVCERGTCKLPTTDPAVLAAQLAEAHPYRSK
jgi:uncharacterized protein YyaL (SSP411 family)